MSKRPASGDATKVRSWLIEYREKKGMTQGQVANAADISQPSYCDIEKGKINPKPETAMRIGDVLEFSWTIFFEGRKEDTAE